jgi:putative nucleotidyltransferase with HDIG domain
VSKLSYRGVSVVVPTGEAVDQLVARADSTGMASRLLERSGEGREALRRCFAAVYEAGLKDGVDRAVTLGRAERTPAPKEGEVAADDGAPRRRVRSPIQAVVARYRSSELTLPQLPEVGVQLNQLLTDPDFEIERVVDLIRRDATLTAKVMALGASPVFAGGVRPPRSLQEAIVRVGSRELVKYLMALANRRLFAFKNQRSEAELRDLWHHSLATAVVAEQLSMDLPDISAPLAFLHGLLHDIGRAILIQIFDEMEEEFPDSEIQRTIDGLHGQFGATLLKKWRFAESFSEVAMFHHQPQKSFSQMRLVAVVALADAVVCRLGMGTENAGEEQPLELHPGAQILAVSDEAIQFAKNNAKRNLEALADMM